MADVTIKKANGSTDITFTAKTPSAGDSAQALWRSDSVGTSAVTRPAVSCVATWNGPRTARKANIKFTYPIVDATGAVIGQAIFEGNSTLPVAMADTDVAEFAAQSTNFIASSLMKSVISSGFAPN
jgi:hypothetical protein